MPTPKAERNYLPLCQLLRWSAICVTMIAALATAQEKRPTAPPKLELPYGPVIALASPDGSRILYGVPYQSGVNDGPQLWLDDTRTEQRRMLLNIGGTLSAIWSPDGSAFSVQYGASDSARAYLYDADTLERLDLASRILAVDPGAGRFTDAHKYWSVVRWEGAQQVLVRFDGHTNQPPPVVCFDFRYRVSRAGSVEKVSQRVSPVNDQTGCEEPDQPLP